MKKRILVISLLSIIVIVIATIIILNIEHSKSESELTAVVQEQEQKEERLPISEDMFDNMTGEMVEYTTDDDGINVSYYKEWFEELIPEHLQDLYLFDKDINISFAEVRNYPDSQQICFSVDNTDLLIIMVQYYISEADYDELACVNKYGTDYSDIYWEDGVPDDAFDVYTTLCENSATSTYVASKSDTGYMLRDCYTDEVTTIDIVDGVYTWSGAK